MTDVQTHSRGDESNSKPVAGSDRPAARIEVKCEAYNTATQTIHNAPAIYVSVNIYIHSVLTFMFGCSIACNGIA